jgi:hypothetical protein
VFGSLLFVALEDEPNRKLQERWQKGPKGKAFRRIFQAIIAGT